MTENLEQKTKMVSVYMRSINIALPTGDIYTVKVFCFLFFWKKNVIIVAKKVE